MVQEFKSLPITFTEFIVPQKITITDNMVTWKKNMGISNFFIKSNSVSILRNFINSVEVINNYISSTIIIRGIGLETIWADDFEKGDAEIIKEILLTT
jgi:hypothetical protein